MGVARNTCIVQQPEHMTHVSTFTGAYKQIIYTIQNFMFGYDYIIQNFYMVLHMLQKISEIFL
jgi:hypothetical protein